MKRMILAAGLIACIGGSTAMAQKATVENPRGKAIIQIFGNFHSGFGSDNDDRGFDLDRAYLGYQYDLGKGLTVKGIMDMGATTDDNDRAVYIKNAYASWKTGNLILNGGLIPTTQFNTAEKFWGYRYAYKSFQDQYGFGSSADLGVSATWQPLSWMSVDGIVVNGEGYKKIQAEDGMLYGLGTTYTPIKGLTVRFYTSINEQVGQGAKNIMNYSAFAGYRHERFSVGAEYNFMENAKGVEDANRYGYSVYGSFIANDKMEFLARFDDIFSKDDWNEQNDERVLLLGAQWKLGKYVKLAPNFRLSMPKADGADNGYSGYISCYFGL